MRPCDVRDEVEMGFRAWCLGLAGLGRTMARRFPSKATSLVNQRRTNFLRPTTIGLIGHYHNLRMLDPTATRLTPCTYMTPKKVSSADFDGHKALARCLFINDALLGVI